MSPFQDIRNAFGLLTRLPVAAGSPAGSSWAWPVVGGVVNALAAACGVLLVDIGLPAGFAAVCVLGAAILLTGGLHEDGLADTADGFWGGRTKERRLEIMKDSRIGSYGVLALVLSLMARASLITGFLAGGDTLFAVIAAGALSRAVLPGLMAALPFARNGGLAASIGRPGKTAAIASLTVGALIAFSLCGLSGLVATLAAAAAAVLLAILAHIKIGGQTGDVLGASQQLAEIAALATLTTLL
ncbi:adenosylcobinamide-GDP ribazoletransferase [Haematobacter missouriensis]|uniref:adenosylcobinamide-GDP ribazoletransferase n=1 Tax=Haematobacter missouriensis TaxID=366616 RepID=UPI003A0FCB4C